MPTTGKMSFIGELRTTAADYDSALQPAGLTVRIATPTVQLGFRHIYHQYVIRVPHRDRVRAYLAECAVAGRAYRPEARLQYVVDTSSAFFGSG